MPDADDRRIKTGVYVVPKEGNTDEGGTAHYIIDSSVGSTLGTKGTITDVANSQTDDNWYQASVTFTGPYQLRDSDNADTFRFLYIKNYNASGGATVAVSLGAEGEWDDADAHSGSIEWDDVSFTPAGVRNGGYWNPDYFIQLPPGASIQLRGDGNIKCDAVHVDSGAGTSTIEFVIAK